MSDAIYNQALKLVEQLPLDEQRMLLDYLQGRFSESVDDWALDGDQLIFMLQHHNAIMDAIERDDDDFLLGLAAADEFKILFGAMGWDEAFDRYEEALMHPDTPA